MVASAPAGEPVFRALADPVRREILTTLADGPRAVGPLARRFPISRPAVSRHLRVLLEAGLVRRTPEGRENVYHLETEPLREAEAWLRSLWQERLQGLKNLVEESRP